MKGVRAGRHAVAVLIAAAFSVSVADAQVIRLAGTVKDDAGRPIRAVVIIAENPDQAPPRLSTTSNDKGQFGFIGIRRGAWTFRFEAPGFEPLQFRRQVAAGRQEPLEIRLSRTATPAQLPVEGTKPDDILQRIDRAEALVAGGDFDGAIVAWREVLTRVPALTMVHLRIGDLYERKADVENALVAYRRLLEVDPSNEKAREAVARLTAKM